MFSLKNIAISLGLLLGMIIIIQSVQLVRLAVSVKSYAAYWKERAEEEGEITYVALGDSAAQGIGASKPSRGYVGLVADEIAQRTGKKVRVVNLSKSGAKIDDVLKDQLPELKKYQADYITIEIGANDIVGFDRQKFARGYAQLVSALPQRTIVASMPYFGGSIRRDGEVKAANAIIADATKGTGLRIAKLYDITRANNSIRNYAADFFHPSDRGYRDWGKVFIDEL